MPPLAPLHRTVIRGLDPRTQPDAPRTRKVHPGGRITSGHDAGERRAWSALSELRSALLQPLHLLRRELDAQRLEAVVELNEAAWADQRHRGEGLRQHVGQRD